MVRGFGIEGKDINMGVNILLHLAIQEKALTILENTLIMIMGNLYCLTKMY